MTVLTGSPPVARSGGAARGQRVALLDRPLTSYYLVIASSLALVGIGLLMVLSASSVRSYSASGSSFAVFERQLMWVSIGLPLMWVGLRLSPRVLRALAYPLLLLSLAGLVLVFVPGLGVTAYGAARWIRLGPLQAQPSELAKLALVLWGADLYARKHRLLGQWKHLLVPLLPVTALVAGVVLAQPDMGTASVLLAAALSLLYVVGAPLRLFGGVLGAVLAGGAVLAVTEPYRLARLTAFANPFADPLNTGYQSVQGLYALASGSWFGVGLGASRQKWSYLPNAHTDYVFAIIGEELGLVGTCVVVALFAVLAYAGIRVAQRTADPFCRLAASGITAWLLVQALVNMGAVTGLLPITGIPLPLVSFGGSSLAVSLLAIGMLGSLARTEPGAAAALAARGPGPLSRCARSAGRYYGFATATTGPTARAPALRRGRAPAARTQARRGGSR